MWTHPQMVKGKNCTKHSTSNVRISGEPESGEGGDGRFKKSQYTG